MPILAIRSGAGLTRGTNLKQLNWRKSLKRVGLGKGGKEKGPRYKKFVTCVIMLQTFQVCCVYYPYYRTLLLRHGLKVSECGKFSHCVHVRHLNRDTHNKSNTVTFNLINSNVSESVLEDRTNCVNACGFRYHLQKFCHKVKET